MIRTLIKTERVLGNKTTLITLVLTGLNGEIKVNGVYAGEMAGHKDLSDSEVAALLKKNGF